MSRGDYDSCGLDAGRRPGRRGRSKGGEGSERAREARRSEGAPRCRDARTNGIVRGEVGPRAKREASRPLGAGAPCFGARRRQEGPVGTSWARTVACRMKRSDARADASFATIRTVLRSNMCGRPGGPLSPAPREQQRPPTRAKLGSLAAAWRRGAAITGATGNPSGR